jgi:NADPH:quinone reductase-like Zn-dependent oxidoreductase
MRAIVVRETGGPEVLKLEEVPDPVAEKGYVLVRVEAAAVNHIDISQRAGMGDAAVPFTPGVDAAGIRVDNDERVLVSGQIGCYAELVAAPAELVYSIPDTLDVSEAAALGVAYRTAWAALEAGGLEAGGTLLVQAGSSGTGQACIDIGRSFGAKVYATASDDKLDRLRDLSAEPLPYNDPRIGELQADVVFDPVGADTYESSLNALKSGGKLVTPGALGGPIAPVNIWTLVAKGATIIGVGAASVSRERFERLIELAGRGKLQPAVDRELPLEQAAEAHRMVEARRVLGKIVLRVG